MCHPPTGNVDSIPEHGLEPVNLRSGLDTVPAWLGLPPGTERVPGIVVLSDMFGPTAFYHQFASDLVGEGYAVLLPDMFSRMEPLPEVTIPAARERLELGLRRGVHDEHRTGGAHRPRRERDALGCVAGAHRPDAPGAFPRRELPDGVVRAADLERPDRLQRLQLEVELRGARRVNPYQWRADGGAVDVPGGFADRLERDVPRHEHRSGMLPRRCKLSRP